VGLEFLLSGCLTLRWTVLLLVCFWCFLLQGPEVMGHFAQFIGTKWKQQFLLQKATEMSPAVSMCLATARSCIWPFIQFDQNLKAPCFEVLQLHSGRYYLAQLYQCLFLVGQLSVRWSLFHSNSFLNY
jgi:hypothetical protein